MPDQLDDTLRQVRTRVMADLRSRDRLAVRRRRPTSPLKHSVLCHAPPASSATDTERTHGDDSTLLHLCGLKRDLIHRGMFISVVLAAIERTADRIADALSAPGATEPQSRGADGPSARPAGRGNRAPARRLVSGGDSRAPRSRRAARLVGASSSPRRQARSPRPSCSCACSGGHRARAGQRLDSVRRRPARLHRRLPDRLPAAADRDAHEFQRAALSIAAVLTPRRPSRATAALLCREERRRGDDHAGRQRDPVRGQRALHGLGVGRR